MIESIRVRDAVKFGHEMVLTIIAGKHSADIQMGDAGVHIRYIQVNPNNNTKTTHGMFVPFANILFISDGLEKNVGEKIYDNPNDASGQSTHKDQTRKAPGR